MYQNLEMQIREHLMTFVAKNKYFATSVRGIKICDNFVLFNPEKRSGKNMEIESNFQRRLSFTNFYGRAPY